ncbi:MAG: ribosome assembly factor SBDS [Candidatus Nanoarchaeia archaeon]|nr:ribosome assembly factor SBDS [Candidatus Nanoarchaeia archaeon]MDD5741248.1 ribosome assembly factor SBDS [Candidatus Nanoarchaeia archaeon]
MTDTVARLRVGSLIFETMVDLDNALKFRKGMPVGIGEVIRDQTVYKDLKKGMKANSGDLQKSFGTDNFEEVVGKIVKKGEIEVTQEHRDAETDRRRKQVVDFLIKNAIDSRTNRPFTPDMIENALNQSGVNIENKAVDWQINGILEKLRLILPIKIETKKLLIRIPAEHTGRVYGIIKEYKEKENWLNDGSLEVVLNLPIGLQSDFYDKLNSITHGSAITKELKEDK